MQPPKIPDNETARLHALRDLDILDSPPEERFDRLTRLAKHMFGTAIALVSLIDNQRQWFKSRQGLTTCETGRDISFCGHAILDDAILLVADTHLDPRFADNPLVMAPPHIRFYAGAPLHTAQGLRIGTLCIIDPAPRQLTAAELRALRDLADCVEAEINQIELKQKKQALQQAQKISKVIVQVQQDFIQQANRQHAFSRLLHEILIMTDSDYGFIGEVATGTTGTPRLQPDSLVECHQQSHVTPFTASDFEHLLTPALQHGQTVLANTPEDISQGHTISSFAAIPIFQGRQLLALIGIANRAAGYQPADIDFLHPLFVTIAQLVDAARVRQQLSADQQELARLSRVASQTTNGVIITDTLGRVEWVNAAFTRMSGYTLEQIRGKTPGSVLQGPATDPATLQRMHDAMAAATSYAEDVLNYHRSGTPYWTHINCNPLRNADGELQGFMAIESDITREKSDAERIRASERRLAAVIEGTHIGTWEWNVQTGETIFNERWANIVGYTLDELQPISIQTWLGLAHPDDLKRSEWGLQQHFSGAADYYDEQCRMRHKLGHWVWVHDRGRVVSWTADGQPLLMSGTHADISEQKRAEATLQENAQHTQAILDHILDGIITIDPAGIIQSVNRAAENIFGYTAEELLGQSVNCLMPSPYCDLHDDYLRQYAQSRVKHIIGIGREVVGQRKSGVSFPLELAVSEITRQGQPMFIGMLRDITERKRVERMKSEFVSTVSHELRTPLTAISGALRLISSGSLGTLSHLIGDMIGIAEKNSQRLALLINDLLDMEKLLAGKMNMTLERQALRPLVEQTIHDNQTYAEIHHTRYRLLEQVDLDVAVDALRLQQVLTNLLSNAAKFSPPDSSVDITIKQHGTMARVEVTDHGPGISEEFRPHLFEKFSQADGSDTRRPGGTGLGLAISLEMIERMGGSIGCESEVGHGATFYFELPIVR